MKQNMTLKPSQLRMKRRIKDLLKRIAKHRHVCAEKNYGHDIHDEDAVGDGDNENAIVIDESEPLDDETRLETVGEELSDGESSESDEENISNISEIYGDDDESKKAVDDTSDIETEDPEANDEMSISDTGETSLDDEIIENMVTNVDEEDVDTIVKDSSQLDFHGLSMISRFNLYKEILQTKKSIDFGDVSNLGLSTT